MKQCLLQSLQKEELLNAGLPNENLKELKERGDQSAFMQYAKQKDMISNLDKKLDYHNIQKEKHPYLNELRSFMSRKKSTNPRDSIDVDSPLASQFLTTQKEAQIKAVGAESRSPISRTAI